MTFIRPNSLAWKTSKLQQVQLYLSMWYGKCNFADRNGRYDNRYYYLLFTVRKLLLYLGTHEYSAE